MKVRKIYMKTHLNEGKEINMFSHDHRLNPRVPHPTAFDGIKPLFMECSCRRSRCVLGLIWRPMTHQFAGSSKIRTIASLKKSMSLVEWSVENSKDLLLQYYHWLEPISNYEALSGEKVADIVKIILLFKMS